GLAQAGAATLAVADAVEGERRDRRGGAGQRAGDAVAHRRLEAAAGAVRVDDQRPGRAAALGQGQREAHVERALLDRVAAAVPLDVAAVGGRLVRQGPRLEVGDRHAAVDLPEVAAR